VSVGSKQWYETDKKAIGEHIISRVKSIRQDQADRRLMRLGWQMMYGGFNRSGDLAGLGGSGFYVNTSSPNRIRFNLAAACVNTYVSLIGTLRPTPRYQCDIADYATYRKARQRSRVNVGQFHDLKVYRLMARACYDAAVYGVGCVYGYVDPRSGKPKLERVPAMELIIDENECANGDGMPVSIFRYHILDRGKSKALFEGEDEILDRAPGPTHEDEQEFCLTMNTQADNVVLVEAWHPNSAPDEGDGRHVVTTLDGHIVFDEKWDSVHFPFVFLKCQEPMIGFWGQGICEQVESGQVMINELIKTYQRIQRLGSNAYVFVNGKSGIRPEALTNVPLTIIRHDGATPEFRTVAATPPDLPAEVDRILQQKLQELGLAPGSTQGTQPKAESGRAKQMEIVLQSKRLMDHSQRFENFAVDLTLLLGRLNDQVVADEPDFTIKAIARREFLANTKWADVMIPEDDVTVTCQTINDFVTTPAGQTDTVDRFIQLGGLSMPQAMEQLEYADAGQQVREANIDREYAMYQLEDILDGKPDVEPNDFQDPEVAASVGRLVRLSAEMDGAPPEVLDAVEAYLVAVKAIMDSQQLAPPPAANEMVPPPPEQVASVA
jgi:hypothetical protein